MSSPFDRHAPKTRNSQRSLLIAGVLTLVLVATLVYSLRGTSPRAASASTVAAAVQAQDTLTPHVTPAEALALLQKDPTANLLRGRADQLSGLENPPRDPFMLSTAWRKSLVAQEPVKLPPALKQAVEQQAYDPDQIKLQGIFRDGAHISAIVNGRVVNAGMIVAGARIVEVQEDGLICQPVGQTDAARFTISLNKPKTKQ